MFDSRPSTAAMKPSRWRPSIAFRRGGAGVTGEPPG